MATGLQEKVHILLVDDSLADQTLISRAVRKAGFEAQLDTVCDGVEAMAFLQSPAPTGSRPDLVLLDINMPRMDGKEVLKAIREDPSLHNLPVIMLTTSDQEHDIVESYDLGVNAYITKPSNLNDFIAAVNTLEHFWFGLARLPSS